MGSKSDPNKAAMKQQKAQMKRLDAIDTPELQEYILQNPELVGLLEAENIDATELANIQLDPRLRDNQMQVLASLKERADEGLTAQDKFQMEELLGQASAQERSQRAAIEQQMAERGMDSSGASLMAKLQGSQSSANNARQRAMQMAAQSQQNRMNALSQLGSQSGNMQNADFARQSQVASAKDAIARANAMNRQNVSSANLAARQGIENQRANTANQQSQVKNQLSQQEFNNQIAKASGQGNVANAMSNISANAPQRPGGLQAGLAGAATGAAITPGSPIGAGIGAGVGILGSMLEDGGIARNEYADGGVPSNDLLPRERRYEESEEARANKADEIKQHESFKKKYMKRIHKELMGEDKKEPVRAQDGNLYNANLMAQDMKKFSKGETPEGTAIIGRGNDKTSAEVQTYEDAEELIAPKEKGVDFDLEKGLGALSKFMEDSQGPKKKDLNLGSFNMDQPQNVMSPIGPSQYSNPFKSARFEDGGTAYASDGMGDIVDSGMESYADDRVDAKINDGEAILNVPQQQRFMDLVRGKISVDELGEDDIVEGVPSDYRDSLHDKIEMEQEPSGNKVEGLKKLLEALGK